MYAILGSHCALVVSAICVHLFSHVWIEEKIVAVILTSAKSEHCYFFSEWLRAFSVNFWTKMSRQTYTQLT